MKRDYYEILGLDRSASEQEVKRAYRRLVRQYHPDVNRNADADTRMKEINEAYEVLSNPQKRAVYDRFGHAASTTAGGGYQDFSGGFGDLGSIFEEFFGGFGRRTGATRRAPRRGADLQVELWLDFEEAVHGCEKEVEIQRVETCDQCNGSGAEPGTAPIRCPECNGVGEVQRRQHSALFGTLITAVTCPRCNGTGETVTSPCSKCRGQKRVRNSRHLSVSIPAGVDDGTQIRLAGEGDAGALGGPPGNLFVVIKVRPHPIFRRRGFDIFVEYKINIVQAALGTQAEIPTLEGEEQLDIPAGTQSGDTIRLRGKGIPRLQRSGRGDQVITFTVVVPKQLTSQQKQLLRELGKTLDTPSQTPTEKSFFERMRETLGV